MASESKSGYIYREGACSEKFILEEIIMGLLGGLGGVWYMCFMPIFIIRLKQPGNYWGKILFMWNSKNKSRGAKIIKNTQEGSLGWQHKSISKRRSKCFCLERKKSKKAVAIISTMHSPEDTNAELENSLVHSNTSFGSFESYHDIERPVSKKKPDFIRDYNNYMGGMDVTDQLIKTYNSHRKTKIWLNKMTIFTLHAILQNSYTVFKKFSNKYMTHMDYKAAAFNNLIGVNDDEEVFGSGNDEHKVEKTEKCQRCKNKTMHGDKRR